MQDTSLTDRFDRLRKALRTGIRAHDRDFDAVYRFSVRAVSRIFWTPVSVAHRAAELLVRDERSHVLDVDAGAGKFCIVGALKTGTRFTGLEYPRHLVTIVSS